MNQEDFLAVLDGTLSGLRSLTLSKGKEYANSDDQLANFRRLGKQLGLPPEAVTLVFLTKHLDSIGSYARSLQGKGTYTSSEPIEGRIDDAILYLVLLKAIVTEREAGRLT
jgi:hypothetical protein